MFLHRQKRIAEFFMPGIQRQRSEELREDSVYAYNGFSPFTLCLTIDKKCNVMAEIISIFLKTKATEKWGTKCNADGNYEKKHTTNEFGKSHRLSSILFSDLSPSIVLVTLVKLLKADPVLHQWVAFLHKKGNTGKDKGLKFVLW